MYVCIYVYMYMYVCMYALFELEMQIRNGTIFFNVVFYAG